MTTRELIAITHRHGVEIWAKIRALLLTERALERLNKRRRESLEHKLSVTPVTMYDSIDVSQFPPNPQAVAGYVDGKWPNYNELLKKFPNAHHVSVAVFAKDDARGLDIENGDATPAEAPPWVRRQHARNVKRPWVYANKSTMPQVEAALVQNGIKLDEVIRWVADPTGKPHLKYVWNGKEYTADACQYNFGALGRNLDVSICAGYCFP